MNRLAAGLCSGLVCGVVACGGARAPVAGFAAQEAGSASQSRPAASDVVETRKLIRTVGLEITVQDTEHTASAIEDLAASLDGYVSSANASRREDLLFYELTVRVPNNRLEDAVEQIRGLAVRIDRERLTTEDVTDRIINFEARMRTLSATEVELQGLLAESRARQRQVDDIMTIYRELTEIRSKIEQIHGQLEALERSVAYATVSVVIRPAESARPVVGDRWRPSDTARGSTRTLVKVLQAIADLALFICIVVVPVCFVLALPIWLSVRFWRGLRSRRAAKGAGSTT